jgi:cyclopropane-fatty-acyl-phospholipid synthase
VSARPSLQLAPASRGAGVARCALTLLARSLRHGTLTVTESHRSSVYGSTSEGAVEARIEVHDASFWRRVIAHGGVGIGESYFMGEWDSDDIVAVLRLLTLNLARINRWSRRLAPLRDALRRPRWRRRTTTRETDRENIAAHYDLGDDFFRLFLDPSLAYSSGVFPAPESSLEEASIEKFDRICHKLGLGPDDHVVEIGTGWGGFAIHAASRYRCRVTTTTISPSQFAYATRAVHEAGLDHLVTVLNRDYRDLAGTFSHLVSIEMIEAVDWRQYETYFAACERLLRPDGLAALQCIVIDDREFERYKTRQDYIRRYIFPGGGLPSTLAMNRAIATATDFDLVDLEDLGAHYVRTLDIWRERLDAHAVEARSLGFDERFLRMWRFYFAYCAAGFAERHVSVVQMILARKNWRGPRRPRSL